MRRRADAISSPSGQMRPRLERVQWIFCHHRDSWAPVRYPLRCSWSRLSAGWWGSLHALIRRPRGGPEALSPVQICWFVSTGL